MQHTTRSFPAHVLRKATAVTLAGVMAVSLCPGVGGAPVAEAVTAAEMQAEAEAALASLNAMQETLDRLSAEYGEAVAAQEEAQASRDAAEERIDEINGEIADLQGRLGERARDMYRSGSVSFIEMLLGAQTFEEFATSLDMLNKANANDAVMVQQRKNLAAEAEEQARVFSEQARVAAQKSEEAAQAASQAQATVAEMQATYDSLNEEAARLLEEERAAREAEEAARAAAIVAASAAAANGNDANGGANATHTANANGAASASGASVPGASAPAGPAASVTGGNDDQASVRGASQDGGATVEGDAPSAAAETPGAAEGGDAYNPEEDVTVEQPAYEGGSDTVSRAYACLGAPYVWGGVGPDGYDCSGLVSYCLSGSHTRLGTTYTFMNWPQVSNPQPGDICVNSGHTGVYIGGGQMIHAATYGVGVIIGPVQSGMIIVRYPG